MRIVHLGKYYFPATGGVETHVRALALAQAALGEEVHVVAINHLDRGNRDITHRTFGRSDTRFDRDGTVTIHRVGRWANFARLDITPTLRRTMRMIADLNPDVWHLHTPNVAMIMAMATIRTGAPLVITHHSDVIRQKLLYLPLIPVDRWVYGRAAVLLSDSPTYIDGSPLLVKHRGKVLSLPLGIDLDPFLKPSAEALTERDKILQRCGSPMWLSVGRLTYYKALHVAIEALRDVSGRLVVIGQGPLETPLRKLAVRLGLEHRIEFWGRTEDATLIGAYHAATALWFPSNARSEGFGQVQVEAMACGCPIINTMIPFSGVPWVSPDGETGLTIPPNNATALAEAANRIWTDPDLRNRFSIAGRDRAMRLFDYRTMAKDCVDIYRSIRATSNMQEVTLARRG